MKAKKRALVLCRADGPRRVLEDEKLALSWEGPFRVKSNLSNGAYRLKMIDDKPIPQTWNSIHLRAFYVQV